MATTQRKKRVSIHPMLRFIPERLCVNEAVAQAFLDLVGRPRPPVDAMLLAALAGYEVRRGWPARWDGAATIYCPRSYSPPFRQWATAHELAHALLTAASVVHGEDDADDVAMALMLPIYALDGPWLCPDEVALRRLAVISSAFAQKQAEQRWRRWRAAAPSTASPSGTPPADRATRLAPGLRRGIVAAPSNDARPQASAFAEETPLETGTYRLARRR